ncbi:hypothetical protein HanLR1_Chr06g0220531 [Helianthus annuus]|nr:hypothetical protein HanLR1_Chr06g0220531 [Helianthus annuus]
MLHLIEKLFVKLVFVSSSLIVWVQKKKHYLPPFERFSQSRSIRHYIGLILNRVKYSNWVYLTSLDRLPKRRLLFEHSLTCDYIRLCWNPLVWQSSASNDNLLIYSHCSLGFLSSSCSNFVV